MSNNMLERMPREIGYLDASMRKLNFANNRLVDVPGELCFLTPSLDLNLQNNQLKVSSTHFISSPLSSHSSPTSKLNYECVCARAQYPFRENYVQGVPYLLDSLKQFCSGAQESPVRFLFSRFAR
jgi:hypothetical protein